MDDKRKSRTHPVRNQFKHWKRWNWHLFATIGANLLFWLMIFGLYDLNWWTFRFFPFGFLFMLFGTFTLIPLAAHYVHVRLAGVADRARIRTLYTRWQRWNKHVFGTVLSL